ncbi:probable protein phosphatase 2C 40 isoform X1 [Olea europaea var. sylvestris]|uniref:probable protein phosphatase 2C 40 isoform X1 n=1 Tax=Olea europaea var. sylvestris TaxID=158386 RepID=UPI000C1D12D9|nr:probable protein phosphatase 2C 40 isoform X1 [Olea europaea var. sylvestris]
MYGKTVNDSEGEIKVSFGYQCICKNDDSRDKSNGIDIPSVIKLRRSNSSFARLSGAAISANATLANTNICNGLFGAEILPSLDSPNSFRRIPSSPTISKLDFLSSSLQSSLSNFSCSPSLTTDTLDYDSFSIRSTSAPSRSDSFLNTVEVQVAGGAAGEDRVQAVCSEENGWVFCAIYDGFNGRDAADFLAGTLYETIGFYLNLLDWELEQECIKASDCITYDKSLNCILRDGNCMYRTPNCVKVDRSCGLFKQRVLNSLERALSKSENDFLRMVEQEMEDRPDLVSVGSCVLLVLLHGKDLYVLNVGDSRAVLATYDEGIDMNGIEGLQAVQLTDSHTVDNDRERKQLLHDHPDDPYTVVAGKVKGKLKVTRALGVGYLKKVYWAFIFLHWSPYHPRRSSLSARDKKHTEVEISTKNLNDALMGILRVRNLMSPPYVSVQPSLYVHEISDSDYYVVLGSDGLFDFFSNDEVVKLVHSYILRTPSGDPAKFLVEQLVVRAADSAGFSMEQLMSVPAGRRRKYHDDVTVIVIVLGTNKRTSKASTCL